MRTGRDGEIQSVVVEEPFGLTSWVTQIAVLTIIIVTGNAGMIFVSVGSIMLVATEAAEILEVVRVHVARGAIVPFPGVFAGENREEGIMVGQHGRSERGHLVAFVAVG